MEENLGIQWPNGKLKIPDSCGCISIFNRDLNQAIEMSLMWTKTVFLYLGLPCE